MENEKLESMLIDYIDGSLDAKGVAEVEQALNENPEVRQRYLQLKELVQLMEGAEDIKPPSNHESIFNTNLANEINPGKTKTVFFTPQVYRIAATIALVMMGVAIGYWINKNNVQERELALLKKEMMETKQLMISMMHNDQSASQRMQGVNVAFSMEVADDEVVDVLAKIMNTDPNTNVRLAAMEALSRFIDEQKVRKILVSSLSIQEDPVIQIALIQLLVRIKESGVINDLERIIENEKNIQAVKDEAHTGIMKLS